MSEAARKADAALDALEAARAKSRAIVAEHGSQDLNLSLRHGDRMAEVGKYAGLADAYIMSFDCGSLEELRRELRQAMEAAARKANPQQEAA